METHILALKSDMRQAQANLKGERFTDEDPGGESHESKGESTKGGIGNHLRKLLQNGIQPKLLASKAARSRSKQGRAGGATGAGAGRGEGAREEERTRSGKGREGEPSEKNGRHAHANCGANTGLR